MTQRPTGLLRIASPILVCVFLPGTGLAQDFPPYPNPYGGGTIIHGPRRDVAVVAGAPYGPGAYVTGWPYGPTVAPGWGYPGLGGGPFVGYPFGFYGYGPRAGSSWTNGLSLYGPPVPTYGPIPGVFGNNDLRRVWEQVPSPGIPFGWVGIYAASPRPRNLSVNVWPQVEHLGPRNFDGTNLPSNGLPTPLTPAPNGLPTPLDQPRPVPPAPPAPGEPITTTAAQGGSLVLSVKVPQPYAQVFVDGVKTNQIGTDRVFDSPPLAAGKEFRYEIVVKWIERGATREEKRIVTGTPGEVVRVDFTMPEVVPTAGK
ncbi:MAG: TIGR03000 domain-containing protein [Planctomycetes bacterium]|nr:TIGR03000 domain-containing protein [Planctomycetota bacterium]